MAAPWCQWRWGAPKWPPTPQTLGAPRRSRDAPRMAASWCQWQNGAPPWPRLDASAVSVKTQDAPRPGARRPRTGGAAQPYARRVGRRAHHADVRALGLLRRRAPLRVLSAGAQGDGSLDPALAWRPGQGAP